MTKKQMVTAFLRDVNENKQVSLSAPYFTGELIDVLLERNLIPETKYNGFQPENDAKFLKGMLDLTANGGTLTDKQSFRITSVIKNITQMTKKNQEALTMRKTAWLREYERRKAEEEAKLPTMDDLTDEQKELIERVKRGENVLVDACIGSGKTTTIQVLCGEVPEKKVLYLTYNRLLKNDAQKRIKCANTTVTNYHGFAVGILSRHGIYSSPSDAIQRFNQMTEEFDRERNPFGKKYDLIILDEYQDVEQEIADELEYVKKRNPDAQIVAVGDMQQKIYDKTTLNVRDFIQEYLGDHEEMTFTKCFRLSDEHASMLGYVWNKEINGVNENCVIRHMTEKEVRQYLAEKDPGDVLCLGTRSGHMTNVLNWLEEHYPDVYNKDSVYASIKDEDRSGLELNGDIAIFTTYDSSKGMERKCCVVFDYDDSNWQVRLSQPNQKQEILRNIFCVAASRGKEEIIFVDGGRGMIKPETLKMATEQKTLYNEPFFVSDMFDHKYKEEVEKCLSLLKVKKKEREGQVWGDVINVNSYDGLVDISPCIGNYQSAKFFKNYDVNDAIENQIRWMESAHKYPSMMLQKDAGLLSKLLYLTYLETGQERYVKQIDPHFISAEQSERILSRLSCVFNGKEPCEVPCSAEIEGPNGQIIDIEGRIDVLRKNVAFELKFTDELEHKHFLQLACYLAFTNRKKGYLWNVKKDEMYSVTVPEKNRQAFLDQVVKTITKGNVDRFQPIARRSMDLSRKMREEWEYEG